jgi:hypothetical protein
LNAPSQPSANPGALRRQGPAFVVHPPGLTLLLLLQLTAPGHAADPERRSREALSAYVERLLPTGSELAGKAVELKLGTLGKVTVILFRPNEDATNYTGWVLVPEGPNGRASRKVVLPPLTVANGLFDIDVKSIFAEHPIRPGTRLSGSKASPADAPKVEDRAIRKLEPR